MHLLTTLGLMLVVTGSTVTYAQDEDLSRYYPLALGDTWIYANHYVNCFEKDCDATTDVLVRRTVVGEVMIDNETYAEVEADVLNPDTGNVLCTSTYGARLDIFEFQGETMALVDIVDVDGACADAFIPGVGDAYLEELRSLANGTPSIQPWQIGGIEYDLMVRGERFDPDLREVDIAFARDVGLLEIWAREDIGPGFSSSHIFRLRYAEVGGTVYGVPPVASESSALTSGLLTIELHPNPTRGSVALQMTGTAAEPSTAEVFDLLGRRLLRRDLGIHPAESSEHRLDLADVPAGLYIVRVSNGSESTTKRLVKVD